MQLYQGVQEERQSKDEGIFEAPSKFEFSNGGLSQAIW
jgi:hypothetical protein